jgi:hypothetical protein
MYVFNCILFIKIKSNVHDIGKPNNLLFYEEKLMAYLLKDITLFYFTLKYFVKSIQVYVLIK